MLPGTLDLIEGFKAWHSLGLLCKSQGLSQASSNRLCRNKGGPAPRARGSVCRELEKEAVLEKEAAKASEACPGP